MTVELNVVSNIKEFEKKLSKAQKVAVPTALAKGLNDTAKSYVKMAKVRADKDFDRGATAFTKRGFKHVYPAKAKDLSTVVMVLPDQANYLKFQIEGGTRLPKGKSILAANTNIMTNLTKQGNLKRSVYNKIIENKERYFKGVPKGDHGSAGIWERYATSKKYSSGQKIRQVAAYIKHAQYKPMYPFYARGNEIMFGRGKNSFTVKFRRHLNDELRRRGIR